MTLVKSNKKPFTNREIKMADKTIDLCRRIGLPCYKRYTKAVINEGIMNCPVSVVNIKRSIHIYGLDIVVKRKRWQKKTRTFGIGWECSATSRDAGTS